MRFKFHFLLILNISPVLKINLNVFLFEFYRIKQIIATCWIYIC